MEQRSPRAPRDLVKLIRCPECRTRLCRRRWFSAFRFSLRLGPARLNFFVKPCDAKTMKWFSLLAALGGVCIQAFAQGTLNFANAGPGLLAKVTDGNGIGLTGGPPGGLWMADLFWAPG